MKGNSNQNQTQDGEEHPYHHIYLDDLQSILGLEFEYLEMFNIILVHLINEPLKMTPGDEGLMASIPVVLRVLLDHAKAELEGALDSADEEIGYFLFKRTRYAHPDHKPGTFLSVELKTSGRNQGKEG